MADILEKKIGGFSTGAWAAMIGGGLALGLAARYVISRRDGGGAGEQLEPMTLTAAVPVGYQTQGAVFGNGGSPAAADAQQNYNNQDWARDAIGWLIKQGEPPLRADAAIRKYIGGWEQLTPEEGQALAKALAWKLPPQQVGAPQVAPMPDLQPPRAPQPPPASTPQVPAPGTAPGLSDAGARFVTGSLAFRTRLSDGTPWDLPDDFGRAEFYSYRTSSPELPPLFRLAWRSHLNAAGRPAALA